MDIERRFFDLQEIRVEAQADLGRVITGHAAVFNKPSEEIFGIRGAREVVKPGAFSKTIRTADVRALINHEDNLVLGRTTNRTLALEEDEVGLKVRILPPDTTYANDLLHLIRGKYITQMSFGFKVPDGGDRVVRDGSTITRELLEVELFDVSPVTFPAYTATDVQARSLFEARIKEIVADSAPNADELAAEAAAAAAAQGTQELTETQKFLLRANRHAEFMDRIKRR